MSAPDVTSPEMIALCRERFPEQTWVIADMRGYTYNAMEYDAQQAGSRCAPTPPSGSPNSPTRLGS